jgi:hypothetical protein
MGYLPRCLGSLAKSTALVLSREGGSISGQMSFHRGLFQKSFHRGLFQKREKRKEKDFNGEVTEKEKEQKSYFNGEGFGTKKKKEERKKKKERKKEGCLNPNRIKKHSRYAVLFSTA